MRSWSILVLCVGFMQGCANLPQEVVVQGPAAIVADNSGDTGPTGGTFFVVNKLDDRMIPNSLRASRGASFGTGFRMNVKQYERQLPASRPINVELWGRVAHAAPLQELFASARGVLYEVSGTIEVTLEPGARYRVNGVMDEVTSEVWIEDEASHRIVGGKVTGAPSAKRLKAEAAPIEFTCCNLHYDAEERWVSDANFFGQPFLPAGTAIKVYDVGSDRAKTLVDGRLTWLGLDYARKQQTMKEFAGKVVISSDPASRIADWPNNVREAIRNGQVCAGMTRDQVIVALGYPRADKTPALDASRWSYFDDEDHPFAVIWGDDGRLAGIEAPADLRQRVLRDSPRP